ncbi:MAG TPA: hypothetical protein P5307_15745 [Pirellulaceae bacterium]|nr:hypothetical protein [Rhodoblastus sp.]HRX80523.1 hypothetical protein [Pirellulaceae bacterium]
MSNAQRAAAIIDDAGGRVVGRTKLQKITYLLCAAGFEDGFEFEYRHYGPYSEGLSDAVWEARLDGIVNEEEKAAQWGGTYSIFSTVERVAHESSPEKKRLIQIAAGADSIVLELAATAVFLARKNYPDPWDETSRRKPQKAERDRLDRAKALLAELRTVRVPTELPAI